MFSGGGRDAVGAGGGVEVGLAAAARFVREVVVAASSDFSRVDRFRLDLPAFEDALDSRSFLARFSARAAFLDLGETFRSGAGVASDFATSLLLSPGDGETSATASSGVAVASGVGSGFGGEFCTS
ncbi:MAG: hypothetical protein M3480_06080, partial [Verrucomicrobiota bacterium]|nr:hypothetical protein [Verrucomicrobiota bacterium]